MQAEFPGNSRREIRAEKPEVTPEPHVDKVIITGKVVRRKKTVGRRFTELLFGGKDAEGGVVGYLLNEVLVPALKDTFRDVVTQGIERTLYGNDRPTPASTRRSSRYSGASHVSYDRYASRSTAPARERSRYRSSAEIDDIVVESQIEAEAILDHLIHELEKYKEVTVAALYAALDETPTQTDHKFGWTDLSNAGIKRLRDGWLLVLPSPVDLT